MLCSAPGWVPGESVRGAAPFACVHVCVHLGRGAHVFACVQSVGGGVRVCVRARVCKPQLLPQLLGALHGMCHIDGGTI